MRLPEPFELRDRYQRSRGPASPGARLDEAETLMDGRMESRLRDMATIRRLEFFVAELPILIIPIFLLSPPMRFPNPTCLILGSVSFFLIFNFGDMVNCLMDRELDKRHKPHLSQAIYRLGVENVLRQIIVCAILALGIGLYLSVSSAQPFTFLAVVAGLFLAVCYSTEPFYFKSGGVLQLVAIWAFLFVGPMGYVATLLRSSPGIFFVAVVAAYGAMQSAIVLLNTAEDYPEDLKMRIRTAPIVVGLAGTVDLVCLLLLLGGSGLSILYGLRLMRSGTLLLLGLLPFLACFGIISKNMLSLRKEMRGKRTSLVTTLRARAKLVPLYLSALAWASTLPPFLLWVYG